MNNADRIIANQKAIKAAEAVADTAKQLGTSVADATRAASNFSQALMSTLPHQYENN